jgi:cation:H+ antiporter
MNALFERLGLWGNLSVFLGAAAIILVAGYKLENWADRIGRRTGGGQVFAGMILLAIATSLPEIATSATAALRGDTQLAVNNLLGGVVIQTMVLALADVVGGKRALTGRAPSFGLLIQGVGLVLILSVVAVVASLGAHWKGSAWLTDVGPAVIVAVYLLMQFVTMRAQRNPRWKPAARDHGRGEQEQSVEGHSDEDVQDADDPLSLGALLVRFGIASAAIFVGGWVVVVCTEQIARSTGASTSFLGFTLVAFTTSLPEVATTFTAARREHGLAAVSNVFGSNGFDVALLGLVALLVEGSLFAESLVPAVFAAALGITVTGIYLLGMLERRDRSIVRMGWDSVSVLLLGAGGMWVMFLLSG